MSTSSDAATVWALLGDDLRRFLRRRSPNDDVAEDLLQETFLRIHRGIPGVSDQQRLPAWVYRIARNVLHDYYRRPDAAASLGEIDPSDDSADEGERPAAAAWLHELIDQLPAKYREAVRFAELEGLSMSETAKRLGVSVSGAKSRVQRGRVLLRQQLDHCCSFSFDSRGRLHDWEPKPARTVCRNCDDAGSDDSSQSSLGPESAGGA